METRARDSLDVEDQGGRTLTITASTEDIDRYDSIVRQNWKLDGFKKNPAVLFAHNYTAPPIAKAIGLWSEKLPTPRLRMKIQFAPTALGEELYRLYREGYMSSWSVGFMPLVSRDMTEKERKRAEKAGHIFTGRTKPLVHELNELYEISAVPVPGNPNAITDPVLREQSRFHRLSRLADTVRPIAPNVSAELRSYLGGIEKGCKHIRDLARVNKKLGKIVGCAPTEGALIAELGRKTDEIVRKLTAKDAPQCTENQLRRVDETLTFIMRKLNLPRARNARGVVPANPSGYSKAPRGEAWKAPDLADFPQAKGSAWKQLSTGVKVHITRHFAWSPLSVPHRFSDLSLPHHRPSDGAVVFAGISAAAGRLNQTKLPSADVPKVKAHLRAHYRRDFPTEKVPESLR